ncbi:uncharacterized protein RJT21DRAFT_3494 [Scheffersomyces amazonensis]|uniref:uncharacterized protein n=1 Tax=Scheffersomyces amazonensis TaxID=1078765 RepID=UPI00315E0272
MMRSVSVGISTLRRSTYRAVVWPYNTHHIIVQARSFVNLPKPISLFKSEPQAYEITKVITSCNSKLLFEIVSSVDQYQTFIPFLHDSFVSHRDEVTGLPLVAGLRVGWKQYDEIFNCNIKTITNKQVIAESVSDDHEANLNTSRESVFEFLRTEWNFVDVTQNKCKVHLKLNYQFKNPLYNSLSSLFNQQITDIMIKAFESRVRELQRHQ